MIGVADEEDPLALVGSGSGPAKDRRRLVEM
jgi:hypothetical protein